MYDAETLQTLATLTPEQRGAVIAVLQIGAPDVIGYGPEQQEAFRHGWNAALDRIYGVVA